MTPTSSQQHHSVDPWHQKIVVSFACLHYLCSSAVSSLSSPTTLVGIGIDDAH